MGNPRVHRSESDRAYTEIKKGERFGLMSRRSKHYVALGEGNRHDIRSQPKPQGYWNAYKHDKPNSKKVKIKKLKGGLD